MSRFYEKIARGEKPDDVDWVDHLVEAHRIGPGMTPRAFASRRTSDGRSSYSFLIRALESLKNPDATVLDLACGDGYLIPMLLEKLGQKGSVIGVDMSESELAVARKRSSDSRVTFHCTRAQALPIASSSVDLVVSHMAFMLMLPIEPVVSELARVLRPGGRFVAVIGNPGAKGGLRDEIQKVSSHFLRSRYPVVKEIRAGDPRVRSVEGLRQIFDSGQGWGVLEGIQDFELEVKTSPEGIWEFMREMYFIDMLPEAEKAELKESYIALGKLHQDSSGEVSFLSPMRKFEITRK